MSRTGTRYLLNNYRILLNIPKWKLCKNVWFNQDYIARFKSGKYILALRKNLVKLILDFPTYRMIYISKDTGCWIHTYQLRTKHISDIQEVYDVKHYEDWFRYIQV